MLKPNELAEELGVSVSTVRAYAREGLIPFAETPKGHRRYDLSAVRRALGARTAPPPLTPGEGPRLAKGPARPIEVVPNWRSSISPTLLEEDASPAPRNYRLRIPVVGVPGTRRFLTNSEARG